MTRERRVMLVLAATMAIVAATAAFVAWSVISGDRDLASRTDAAQDRIQTFESSRSATDVQEQRPEELAFQSSNDLGIATGDVLMITRVPGDDYGRLAVISPQGERTLLDKTCERSHLSGSTGICLNGPGPAGRYSMEILDFSNSALPLLWSGTTTLPSRARVSADQRWASSTVFLNGSSYQDLGELSTTAWIVDLEAGGETTAVDAMVIENAEPHHDDPTSNFWGVSFGQGGDFWVTGAFGDQVEILQGSMAEMHLTPTGIEGSCPSLSPDGSTLVYKRQLDNGEYQLVARNLDSGETWDLGETRPVDDQVEWLDNDTILYGMHVEGWSGSPVDPEFDVWMVDITPGSQPALFAPQGDSPAVVR